MSIVTGRNGTHLIEQLRWPDMLRVTDQTKAPGYETLRPRVSLIIPTLNESQNLPLVLPYIPMDWVDEILMVDGRSTDYTPEVAREIIPAIKLVYEPRHGKGAAMAAGYRQASGDILIVMDADGSNDPREIPRFVRALMEGADFARGSRFAPGGGTTDMPRLRKLGNGGFVSISNLLFGTRFTDLCYGYHAFWRHCLDYLTPETTPGFEIDTSLYLQAVHQKLHIVEVPSFEGVRFYGHGKLQTVRDGFRVLRAIGTEWISSLRNRQSAPIDGFRGPRPVSQSNTILKARSMSHSQALANSCLRKLSGTFAENEDGCETVIHQLLMIALNEVDAQSGSLMLFDRQGKVGAGHLVYDGAYQVGEKEQIIELVNTGLAGWVLNHRSPALVENTSADPRWVKRIWDGASVSEQRSALSVPLIFDSQVSAILTLVRSGQKPFTEADLSAVDNAFGCRD